MTTTMTVSGEVVEENTLKNTYAIRNVLVTLTRNSEKTHETRKKVQVVFLE